MCGIVSVISRRANGFFGADLDLFENLLVLDTLRGLDSTGVFSVDVQKNIHLTKIGSHPLHLFACDEWKKWRGRAVSSARIVVGHNRKATQGTINSKNAHPFHEGNIVLVHNGTLRNHKTTLADKEVDSHALCHAFNEKGAENVIPTIDGAFALMWWDIEKQKLFAVRNDERPLSIVETDDFYVVCSESWMALQLLARANKKVTDVIPIGSGMLHEFNLKGEFAVSTIKVQDSYAATNYMHGGTGLVSSVHLPKQHQSGTHGTNTKGSTHLAVVRSENGGEKTNSATTDPSAGMVDLANHIQNENFLKGRQILCRFVESSPGINPNILRMVGKCIEPGLEAIDVVAIVPVHFHSDNELRSFMGTPMKANILKYTESAFGGPSVYVNQLHLPEMVDVHNNKLTKTEWDYVVTNCLCKKCSAKIYDEEVEFTSVSRKPNNRLSVTCADCIEDKLVGDFKHEFTQNRLTALQNAELDRQHIVASAGDSPTVH